MLTFDFRQTFGEVHTEWDITFRIGGITVGKVRYHKYLQKYVATFDPMVGLMVEEMLEVCDFVNKQNVELKELAKVQYWGPWDQHDMSPWMYRVRVEFDFRGEAPFFRAVRDGVESDSRVKIKNEWGDSWSEAALPKPEAPKKIKGGKVKSC